MNQNENCHVCSEIIKEKHKFIECEICGNYVHLKYCSQIKVGLRRCTDYKGEEE